MSSDVLEDELDVVSGLSGPVVPAIEKVSEIPPSASDVDPAEVVVVEVTELVLVDATTLVVLADSSCSIARYCVLQAKLGVSANTRGRLMWRRMAVLRRRSELDVNAS